MAIRKLPFIQSVKLGMIDGSEVIPTTLLYEQGRALIGREAREQCTAPELLIEDFKIELGRLDPDNPVRRSAAAAEKSPRRTALGLAKDFFDEVLRKFENSLSVQGLPAPAKILIAEPLSLADSDKATETWLSNYRRSIRKVLQGRFKEIDFLPEPFAVREYEGAEAFSDADVHLVNPKEGAAINLSPLFLWGLNTLFSDNDPDLYEFDGYKDGTFVFKAVQFRPEISVTPDLKNVWETLQGLRERDQKKLVVHSITLSGSET